jgi:DNA-binding transcriptional regulator LsrR (DeoR family)
MVENNAYEEELIIKVSWLYYFSNLTQLEIAKKMNLSRSKVGRLLRKALADGIIEIKFKPTVQSYHPAEESEIESRFNVQEAIITNSSEDPDQLLDNLGRAGARYLNRVLKDNFVLGIGMGKTIKSILPHVVSGNFPDSTIVTLSGGFSQAGHDTTDYNISWPIAEKFGARLEQMLCPLIAETPEARNAIISDSNIQAQMEQARQCDIGLVSIGPVNHVMNLYSLGYIAKEDVSALLDLNIVGEVLSSFYDISGNVIQTELNQRSLGLEIPDLKEIGTCVAISGGLDKTEAILGALRNGFLDVMITDINTAEAVLQLADRT